MDTPTVASLKEDRRKILGIKHWRAIPELKADMKAINRQLRALQYGEPRKPKPEVYPIVYRPGAQVVHSEHGRGEVIYHYRKLGLTWYVVRFNPEQDAIPCLADDLKPAETGNVELTTETLAALPDCMAASYEATLRAQVVAVLQEAKS